MYVVIGGWSYVLNTSTVDMSWMKRNVESGEITPYYIIGTIRPLVAFRR